MTPRFYSLTLWTGLGCEPRLMPEAADDGACRYGGDLMRINCTGGKWEPVISDYIGALICEVSLADELTAAGLRLGERVPVEICDVDGAIRWKRRPKYAAFRPRRGIALDDAYAVWPEGAAFARSGIAYRQVPLPETWNGDDLFGALGKNWRSLYVSRRFVETAHREKWKCFAFTALDLPHDVRRKGPVVIGREKWPPVWYPEGTEPHPGNLGPMPEPAPERPAAAEQRTPPAPPPPDVPAWEEPAREEEEDTYLPTGHTLLGRAVVWGFPPESEDPDMAALLEYVKGVILEHMEAALAAAGEYLTDTHQEAEGEDGEELEVYEARVEVVADSIGQEEAPGFLWELHIGVLGAGPCESHFLTFRGAALVETTAAD